MGKLCNLEYVRSLSGMFRLLTVIVGFPAVVFAWIAYFSSSWTKTFPEIIAILIAEKSVIVNDTVSSESESAEYDLITDKEEEYMDEILLQTLMYEKFFIGIVSILFLISLAYLLVRVLSRHQQDSPYEIMFDFIYHVLAALGLLTGGALVFLSAAKIQSFIDHVSEGFAPDVVTNIIGNKRNVQDKTDKIIAAVLGILNGILYVLCVVSIRMTKPIRCNCFNSLLCVKRKKNRKLAVYQQSNSRRVSSTSSEYQIDAIPYGIYGNQGYN